MPNFDCSPTKNYSNIVTISSNTITPPPVSGTLGQHQEKKMGIQGTVTPTTNDMMTEGKKKSCVELKPSKAQLK